MAFRLSIARIACVALAASLAGGCSPGDVQLEGKVFDALGVSGNQASRETPKVAARSPLIVPPSLERLPQPGEGQQNPSDSALAAINDPDRAKEVDEVALAKAQAEYCEKHYAPAKALNAPEADSITGPAGPCRPSVLNAIGWGKQ
jgi:hypothetical protein